MNNIINQNPKVIIIIGLPGSGKTLLASEKIIYENEYIIFDDFVSEFYDGKALDAIILNKKVCLIDPRLCLYEIFNRFINIVEIYVDKKDIHLILFHNEPEKCIANVQNRGDGKTGIIETIKKYSAKYSLDNYEHYKPNITTGFVWQCGA